MDRINKLTGRKRLTALSIAAALIAAVPVSAGIKVATAPAGLLVGAAVVDSTWHVGGPQGQHAAKPPNNYGFDPYHHSTAASPSYGIQGREYARALVMQGTSGQRVAIVSNDMYIPQDLLNRRVADILMERDRNILLGLESGTPTAIDTTNLTVSVSHSHSSPYLSTPSWGVWTFEDAFDLRFYEHIARSMADAVIAAASDMRPARVGAGISAFSHLKRHSFGPQIADDLTPAGYPQTDVDQELSVVRFDDISDPAAPRTLANWVVFGLHPEMGNPQDLLTSEYINTMETIVDREQGGVTLFSQNDTGTSEPDRDGTAHAPELREQFSRSDYNQIERAGRMLADVVERTSDDIATVSAGGFPATAKQVQKFKADPVIAFKDLRFAPPSARPTQSVSNCRTEQAFHANPGIPILGLPDCSFPAKGLSPIDPGVAYSTLKAAGVPIPDNTFAASLTGLEETPQIHLQALRIGDIGITICPCEQWADQTRNIKSRLNALHGDIWYGFDWMANYQDAGWQPGVIYDGRTDLPGHGQLALNNFCTQNADTTWTCKNPKDPKVNLAPVSDTKIRHMKAQIYNDATGWDLPENSLTAESEPADLSKIWGNFSHEELDQTMDGGGYPMVITVGMSNDYNGYIASYREFQRGDHYRKALTGLGPHSEDFLATRLTRMAAELKGGRNVALTAKDVLYGPEDADAQAKAHALGLSAQQLLPAYEASLPADGGTPSITAQPGDVSRFGAAKMTFVGGSTYADSPRPTIERCVLADKASCESDASAWRAFGNGYGEAQVMTTYPQPGPDLAAYGAGQFNWVWKANFEAYDSDIDWPDLQGVRRRQTPAGVYRFVIDGCHRGTEPSPVVDASLPRRAGVCIDYDPGRRSRPYHLASASFQVRPFEGITIKAFTKDANGLSFGVGPDYLDSAGKALPVTASNTERGPIDYPNTYATSFRFIGPRLASDVKTYSNGDIEAYCLKCTFRAWADTGSVASAFVTVVRSGGGTESVSAVFDPADQRWHAAITLGAGDSAYVSRGGVTDEFGEINGLASASIIG